MPGFSLRSALLCTCSQPQHSIQPSSRERATLPAANPRLFQVSTRLDSSRREQYNSSLNRARIELQRGHKSSGGTRVRASASRRPIPLSIAPNASLPPSRPVPSPIARAVCAAATRDARDTQPLVARRPTRLPNDRRPGPPPTHDTRYVECLSNHSNEPPANSLPSTRAPLECERPIVD